jgi:hypothetical protein
MISPFSAAEVTATSGHEKISAEIPGIPNKVQTHTFRSAAIANVTGIVYIEYPCFRAEKDDEGYKNGQVNIFYRDLFTLDRHFQYCQKPV